MDEGNRKEHQSDGGNELDVSAGSITALLHGSEGIDLRSVYTRDIYLTLQAIVGMRFQGGADGLLRELGPGSRVTFLREPDNAFDKRAVMAVDGNGRKLGYIPRNQNAVISALMDAGKSFYGIVTEESRRGTEDGDKVPGTLYVELYMREFTGPEDQNGIPRQGEQGSYAVVSVRLTEEDPVKLKSIFAIKVINGEERGIFHEWNEDTAFPEAGRKLVEDFDRFAGYLPLVGHGIDGKAEETLAEAYGVLLGKAFSNRTIDTAAMVREHLPDLAGASLEEINETIDLGGESYSGDEALCRKTWSLYRRMDRSELERKMSVRQVRLTPLEELLDQGELTEETHAVLHREGLVLLGDVMDRSSRDLLKMSGITPENVGEIRSLLRVYGAELSEEAYEEDFVKMTFPEEIDEIEKQVYEIVLGFIPGAIREMMNLLSEKEKQNYIDHVIEGKLQLSRKKGERGAYLSTLFLGAFSGYRGDYSEAGFALLKGLDGIEKNETNGYLVLGRFYEDRTTGRLRPKTARSMLKVCAYLADGLMEEKYLDGVMRPEDRIGASLVLYRQAVSYARFAPKTKETMELLSAIGQMFLDGDYETTDGEHIAVEEDAETAYKAFYYAAELGDSFAQKMKERVLELNR